VGNIGILTLPSANQWGIVVCTWLATVISPVSNMFFVTYAVAAIAAPQLWLTTDAPRFSKGLITNLVSFGCLISLFLGWSILAKYENKRRDLLAAASMDDETPGDSDVTDKEDMAFRFTA